ncbi:MAG: META domain-containing protein [Halorhodospira halophila]|uniref:META domain-containing protein n=1 Tax=Halorhodospira TaxID=85108 RepID=UPI001914882C|nr:MULTISPECIES: META domain-containing protein [Halorhodospira]MBK5935775.1 hypothetical protein [Halorhodospira halophila]MBK5943461.1 hypothetical protein [Halorhodospira halophila]MCC3751244.1 META domain-containing protein [Halorhodospira halophila]MCG5526991.1 META domain-containing protein [Halorhodospira halophila]MCG5532388.1 META domain-containing protein [Halorhodospira sp. 9621]
MTTIRTVATTLPILLLLAACATPERAQDREPAGVREDPPAPLAEAEPEPIEAPETVPEPAPGLGTADEPFIARGQEPGWMLRMDGERMRLLADYGRLEVAAAQPDPEVTDTALRYTAETDNGRALEVVVEQALCADVATGMPHPYRVDYTLDGTQHRGCGGDPRALLTGGEWQIVAVDGEIPEAIITLDLDAEGRVHGQAPCNRYAGAYRLTGERIVFSGLAATRMACRDAGLAEAEQAFLDVLAGVYFLYMPEVDRLRLLTADGRRLEAVRAEEAGGVAP